VFKILNQCISNVLRWSRGRIPTCNCWDRLVILFIVGWHLSFIEVLVMSFTDIVKNTSSNNIGYIFNTHFILLQQSSPPCRKPSKGNFRYNSGPACYIVVVSLSCIQIGIMGKWLHQPRLQRVSKNHLSCTVERTHQVCLVW